MLQIDCDAPFISNYMYKVNVLKFVFTLIIGTPNFITIFVPTFKVHFSTC